MRRLFFLILLVLPLLRAELLDRVAIVVGREVITELQLDEEIRVTAFLNRAPLAYSADTRRAAADRLVEQLLVKHEMEMSHYPLPDAQAIDNYLQEVRESFGSAAEFAKSLSAYSLTEATLREHLALQLTTLRFIEFRFRPNDGISDADMQNEYQQKITAWKAAHPGVAPPKFDDLKESIRQDLVEKRTDEVLDTWLEESRKQINIVYLDRSLQ